MTKEDIEFRVEDLKLRGRMYIPDGKAKNLALLFIHGWTGKPNDIAAEILSSNGFYTMTFSLSGHNDSDGKIKDQTRQKSLNELIAAYDLLKSRIPENTKIAVVGNSYGGYLAPVLSSKRKIAAISIRVPANYKDNGFDKPQIGQGHESEEVRKWRHMVVSPSETMSLRAIHAFSGPIQIIEAQNDAFVPRQAVQNYIDAIKDKNQLDYNFMKGWPHSLGDNAARNKQFQKILIYWAEQVADRL